MDVSARKQIVSRFFEYLNTDRRDDALALLSDDLIWSIPRSLAVGGGKDKSEFAVLLGSIRELFIAQPRYTVISMTAESARVAVELVSEGDLKNGKRFENYFCMVFFIAGERIHRVNEYVDTLYFVKIAQ